MSGYSYGNLRYDYKITINIEGLVDTILDKIGVSGEDWFFDDTHIVVEGSDKCRYKHWHCDATRLDPPEDETEMIDSLADVNIEQAVIDGINEWKEYLLSSHKEISECEIDEESFDYEPDEPDEDAIYDAWRDRQLGED